MTKLILMRHGQSLWNSENRFTGWIDIPLSDRGIEEAFDAAEKIKMLPIDVIFTSTLIRAIMTAMLVMSKHHSKKVPVILHPGEGKLEEWAKCYSEEAIEQTIPVIKAWELNERMYGALQGLNKDLTRKKYGEEQVKIWRRSYDIPPPQGESLEMTAARTLPYFYEQIVPYLKTGKNVLISAHGNSLRSIIMSLDKLTKEQVIHLELATGLPLIYEYDQGEFRKNDV